MAYHKFGGTLRKSGVDLRPTNVSHLERWLGEDAVRKMSKDMTGWYGPPIAVGGVPGAVFATGDGDFVGRCEVGRFGSALDQAWDIKNRMANKLRQLVRAGGRVHHGQLNAGFSSLSDLISEATTGGKRYMFRYSKSGPTGVANVTSSHWRIGPTPAVGTTPAAAPGGTAFDDSSTGGNPFTNPSGGDTMHLVAGNGLASVAGNSLLLYDLIFGVAKTMNSTGTESVTGVPTRYQNSTGGTADFAGGNFLFIQVGGTALAAVAHNWTVCRYRDQDNNDTITLPTVTGNSSAIVDRLDQPTNTWFCPLATGDTGVKDLDQMQCSALVTTGVVWFMIGHPIAWMQFPIANMVVSKDYVQTAFSLTRIFDDACLTTLEVIKPSATATTYNVDYDAVAG